MHTRPTCSLLLLISILFICCEDETPLNLEEQVTIQQGIWGQVTFWEGDFMPPGGSGTITPVVRVIDIHTPTTEADALPLQSFGPLHDSLLTAQVGSTQSDEDGFYQIALDTGKFSVFVREGDAFFAGISDGDGHLQPVRVNSGVVTRLDINIDYLAAY